MDLIADQGFPASIQLNVSAALKIGRWTSELVADQDLLKLAAREGFHGVIFLGKAEVFSPEFRARAREAGVALIGTSDSDPVAAANAVGSHFGALARLVGPGVVLLVRGTDVVPLED